MVRYLSAVLAGILFLVSARLSYAAQEDGVAFEVQSYVPGTSATVYVQDADLSTTGSCTATWSGVSAFVPQSAWWNLANGTPPAAQYTLSPGCTFDTDTPANTPLVMPPAGELPWAALVNGGSNWVDDFGSQTGEFTLLNDVNPGDTAQINFHFDVVDSYAAVDHRVRVYSSSDPVGEWLSLGEVASQEDATDNPASDLFKGSILLEDDQGASVTGDGAVLVQSGDALYVVFYTAGGITEIAVGQGGVSNPPTPTPTPVAGVGIGGLVLMAGMMAFTLLRRLTARAE